MLLLSFNKNKNRTRSLYKLVLEPYIFLFQLPFEKSTAFLYCVDKKYIFSLYSILILSTTNYFLFLLLFVVFNYYYFKNY